MSCHVRDPQIFEKKEERWRETNEPPSQPPPNKTRQSETKLRE